MISLQLSLSCKNDVKNDIFPAEHSVRGSAWLAGSECQSVGRAGYLLILLQAGDGLQHVRM